MDRENVIKGLEHCTNGGNGCFECPYSEDGFSATIYCKLQIDRDSLAMLKELKEDNVRLDKENQKLVEQMAQQPQIVRCKDCVHYSYHTGCKRFLITGGGNEWFCADGVKK